MRDIVSKSRVLVGWAFVLVVLSASPPLTAHSQESTLLKTVESKEDWLQKRRFPEISYLRRRADSENASVQGRGLARSVVQRWDNGVVDPEPVLIEAWLERGMLDEYTGRMTYGLDGPSGTAPGALSVLAVDEDRDLCGVRIRERYVLPNGVESSFGETYPAYLGRPSKSIIGGATVIPVHFRSGNRVKDERRWRAYADRVMRDGPSRNMETPPIWITPPDPNAVEVFVSVYDEKGHESRAVPVRLLEGSKKRSIFAKRQALKPYREHGADIARWPDAAITPLPGNAALLYYRASLCLPEADPCTVRIMDRMWKGREPDDCVREYLGGCLKAFQLAQLASQIPQCDWGLIYDPLWEHRTEAHLSLRRLSRALVASARTLAFDGHYRAAFENCLVVRRLAGHIGDDTYILYCMSRASGYMAMRGILDVLTKTPSESGILTWLRDQLTIVKGTPSRPAVAFGKWRDRELMEWRPYDGDKPFDRSWALGQIEDKEERKKLIDLTDEQLLVHFLSLQRMRLDCQYGLAVPDALFAQARKEYDGFLASVVAIMQSGIAYPQKQDKLKEMTEESYYAGKRYDAIALLGFPGEGAQYYHQFTVSDTAYLNCALVAISVRLTAARTGQLPEALPDDFPKDPFTGEEFEYELTEDGFVLRFDPERVSGIRIREFRFKAGRP